MEHNLSQVLMPIAVIGSLGASLIFFTRILTDYILKKKMIEKGYVNDDTQAIFKRQMPTQDDARFSSLKWGLITFFAGLSLIITEYISVSVDSPLPYGVFTVAVSFGFLLYYFIVQRSK